MKLEAAASEDHPFAHDKRLASEVLSKDRKATAAFVERFSGPVYGFVRRRLAYRPEAVDDIVQEVFLAAWRSLDRFRGESSLQTWLLSIARHKVDDYHRRRAREATWPDEIDFPDNTDRSAGSWNLERVATQDRLESALEKLPEHYSLVLSLRYLEEQTVKQIADVIGKTEKSVERTLARAREQFRERWHE